MIDKTYNKRTSLAVEGETMGFPASAVKFGFDGCMEFLLSEEVQEVVKSIQPEFIIARQAARILDLEAKLKEKD